MKTKSTVLAKEERDILILGAMHPNGRHLSNSDIGQRLGISVSRVKTLIHQACVKLGAHNRNEAILFAIRQGEISLNELYSQDELAEFWSSLYPDMLRRIIHLIREELGHGHLPGKDEQIIPADRRQDTLLTKRERDVLILVGRGLTDREMADTLQLSIGAVRSFLYRAYAKLGARKRADAVMLALKRGEISIAEMYSLNELLEFLAPLGAESVEKLAQLINQKLRQEPIPTGS
jgi:DNA-binding CsgD family transcriptional regulator